MIRSFDGGATWTRPRNLFTVLDGCAYVEPSIGRCVMDGVGGARDDLMPDPSVDIANGAPTGADATNQIVLVDHGAGGPERRERPVHARRPTAAARGATSGQRHARPATAGTTPLRRSRRTAPTRGSCTTRSSSRSRSAPRAQPTIARWTASCCTPTSRRTAPSGPFSLIHRGASGDARGSSQNNLAAEFLGDYVYAAATRTYGTAVWNDVRNAADCPAIDEFRQELHEEAVALPGCGPPKPRSLAARAASSAEEDPGGGRRACPPSSRIARPPSATPTSSAGPIQTRNQARVRSARGAFLRPSR